MINRSSPVGGDRGVALHGGGAGVSLNRVATPLQRAFAETPLLPRNRSVSL